MDYVLGVAILWSSIIVFYTLYLAAINLLNNKDTSKWILVGASPMILVMIVVDIFMQMTLVTIFFLDFPKEFLVTTRLKRYRAQTEQDWRHKVAVTICTTALNPFDPTRNHC